MAQQIAQESRSPAVGEPAASDPPSHHHKSAVAALALGSLGVVFGDIGTSPLYALRESLHHMKDDGVTDNGVIGTVSLLLWALFFTVTAKYVLFLMRADNKGEGGMLSLMALAQHALGHRTALVFFLGVAGAALFSGDAIITPAISVLSALEGLELRRRRCLRLTSCRATIVILISLFWAQSHGTARVAALFRPDHGGLLPHHRRAWRDAYRRFAAHPARLRSDLRPALSVRPRPHRLRRCWARCSSPSPAPRRFTPTWAISAACRSRAPGCCFVLPALTLNYLGQGALVLSNPAAVENPFFLMAPPWALLPLVVSVDGRHRHREPGGDHRRLLAAAPGDPAWPPAAHADPAHLRDAGRPDFHSARQSPAADRRACCSCCCSRLRARSPRPMASR